MKSQDFEYHRGTNFLARSLIHKNTNKNPNNVDYWKCMEIENLLEMFVPHGWNKSDYICLVTYLPHWS